MKRFICLVLSVGATALMLGLAFPLGNGGSVTDDESDQSLVTYDFTYHRSQSPIEPAEIFEDQDHDFLGPRPETLNILFVAGEIRIDSVSLSESDTVVISGRVDLGSAVERTDVIELGVSPWMEDFDFTLEYLGTDIGVRTTCQAGDQIFGNSHLGLILQQICAPCAHRLRPGIYGDFNETATRSGIRIVSRGIPMGPREQTDEIRNNYVAWAYRSGTDWPSDILAVSDYPSLSAPIWAQHSRLSVQLSD